MIIPKEPPGTSTATPSTSPGGLDTPTTLF
jgi:hypothetical protein